MSRSCEYGLNIAAFIITFLKYCQAITLNQIKNMHTLQNPLITLQGYLDAFNINVNININLQQKIKHKHTWMTVIRYYRLLL